MYGTVNVGGKLNGVKAVALGSDHAGFDMKTEIAEFLQARGVEVKDFGTFSKDSCDYPDYARLVAEAVSGGEFEHGILVCGSGVGVSIVANKVRKVRAALVLDVETAMLCKQHNNANVLCLAGRTTGISEAMNIIETWLLTAFEGGRHAKRVSKIEKARSGEQGLF